MKRVYLCDIRRNRECSKEGCIFRDGPCMMTTEPEYAWRIGKETFSHGELMDWAGEMWGDSNVDAKQPESGS